MPRPCYRCERLPLRGTLLGVFVKNYWFLEVGTLQRGPVCKDIATDVRSTLYLVYLVSNIGSWYFVSGTWNFAEILLRACVPRPRYRCEIYIVLCVFGTWNLAHGTL